MRRAAPLLALLLAGCSTAPVADFLDFFVPGRARVDGTPPYGGVCIPQGGPVVAPTVPTPVLVAPPGGALPGQIPPPPAPVQPMSLVPPPGGGGNDVPVTRSF